MDDPIPLRSKDSFVYWTLLFYAILFSAISFGEVDFIRIPTFALLLLVLTQVIFPQFRCTKRANLFAVIVIVFIPLFFSNLSIS